jgi:hypothetical protein
MVPEEEFANFRQETLPFDYIKTILLISPEKQEVARALKDLAKHK